jgi:hypothetical protein
MVDLRKCKRGHFTLISFVYLGFLETLPQKASAGHVLFRYFKSCNSLNLFLYFFKGMCPLVDSLEYSFTVNGLLLVHGLKEWYPLIFKGIFFLSVSYKPGIRSPEPVTCVKRRLLKHLPFTRKTSSRIYFGICFFPTGKNIDRLSNCNKSFVAA